MRFKSHVLCYSCFLFLFLFHQIFLAIGLRAKAFSLYSYLWVTILRLVTLICSYFPFASNLFIESYKYNSTKISLSGKALNSLFYVLLMIWIYNWPLAWLYLTPAWLQFGFWFYYNYLFYIKNCVQLFLYNACILEEIKPSWTMYVKW